MPAFRSPAAALLLLAAVFAPRADAAESYDNCSGFIDALPAVITTQGVWCLRADLSTNVESGTAVSIQTNNVTIDCNGFKIGNLQASSSNFAYGISASSRNSIAVRGCNLRGFGFPLRLTGAAHRVEDNLVVAARFFAMEIDGDGSLIRGNTITDTLGSSTAVGIYALGNVDIVDNVIDTVRATNENGYGILAASHETPVIRGNHIRGLVPDGPWSAYGIWVSDSTSQALVQDNYVASGGTAVANTWGIRCTDADVVVRGNSILGFTTGLDCTNAGSNVVR